MLARLSKTLSTNVAVAGLTALVLGAGGTTATLAASHAPNDHASDTAKQQVAADADGAEDDADETPEPVETESADEQGTRPTDTHGYCVSQVAQAPLPEGSTDNHGALVSAAAKACGKDTAPSAASSKSAEKKAAAQTRAAAGKAHAKHATGKPTG